ncbi:hypothetical protein SBOR_5905 [Sclerotinia borealis F-4128]|uniref:Uncharacterized protein n=1 Tax=Sclerotinia borealis (strain F-4128) TaxID=1432307 RepID=W9CGQ5_SCLBF|nr:hypothetical protein SBOR_5905 [Sclerotinia borealis F-4128]
MDPSKQRTSLRTFPIEIRDIIYRLLLQAAWDGNHGQGQVRNILAALRNDPSLYKEALAVFYNTNTFCLTHRNVWLQRYFIQHNGVRFMDTCVVYLASTLRNLYIRVPLSEPISGHIKGFGILVDHTIRQFDMVFETSGCLEGALTGDKSSWLWEHRGEDQGRPLRWENRLIVRLADLMQLNWRDLGLYNCHQMWAARSKLPSIYYAEHVGTPQERYTRYIEYEAEVSYASDSFERCETVGMWRSVEKWEFLAVRGRCEKEQQRGSLIHHEKKDDDHLTKWLYDQGFECEINPAQKHLAASRWRQNQWDWGNPSQRGEEGELDYVPKVVDVDDFVTKSRAPSLDRQPTAAGDPSQCHTGHSAFLSYWSRADSDENLPRGDDASDLDPLMIDKIMRAHGIDWRGDESMSTGDTQVLEDMVFYPGEARYQIFNP